MAESVGSEAEEQVVRSCIEKEVDVCHPEVSCDNILVAEVSKGDSPLPSVDTSDNDLTSKEVNVKISAMEKVLPDNEISMKLGTETDVQVIAGASNQASIKNTEQTAEAKKSMDSGDIAMDNAKSEVEHTDSSDQETMGKSTDKPVPELVTENCSLKCAHLEFENSGAVNEQSDAGRSEIPDMQKEKVDESAPLVTADTDMETKDDPSDSKDDYRETVEISDSETEDSDSSSISSLSSPSNSGSKSDSDECVIIPDQGGKGNYCAIKAPGELLPEDLPPIEELHITVPSALCAEIGVVTSIVQTLVVIQSCKGVPALDLDSVLFLDHGSRALGTVFDVFGPVTEPLYCVRFNSADHIAEFNVNPGDQVYYAPQTEHSKYVFLQQLMRMRGSDASRKDDLERCVQVEFSDDEEERKARRDHGDEMKAEEDDPDQLKRKRDANEVSENKKKFAPHFPPRNQRGGSARPQFAQRGRPAYRRQQTRPQHEGPLHPPNFNFPPPPIPSTSAQRPIPPMPQNTYSSYSMPQGSFNNQSYQSSMQPNASFGQLPYVQPQGSQPQVDPRVFQFGAQFAQMVCNLQNLSPTVPVNAPSPQAPSFSVPYNQPMYSGSQNTYNPFYQPLNQNPPNYSAPPFSSPPPNMPRMNIPPPQNQTPYSQQPNVLPNQDSTYGNPYGSPFSTYNSR